jgi:phage terminase large subunit GpA-like protein
MTLAELVQYTYQMFRPPKLQTVSEWADDNRILVSESSSEPGPWRPDRAPYQREIMDAFTDREYGRSSLWRVPRSVKPNWN